MAVHAAIGIGSIIHNALEMTVHTALAASHLMPSSGKIEMDDRMADKLEGTGSTEAHNDSSIPEEDIQRSRRVFHV